jgi:hypothetical protein
LMETLSLFLNSSVLTTTRKTSRKAKSTSK